MKIRVPMSEARRFEFSMIENPMVEIISANTQASLAFVHYELDAPDFFELPTYADKL